MDVDFSALKNKKICIVGDVIVDHYRFLKPLRLSPEAPVVIFGHDHEEFRPGGAGNVATSLHAMGAKVFLYSVVGKDHPCGMWPPGTALYPCEGRITTTKERLVTERQQIARVDTQSNTKISDDMAGNLVAVASEAVLDADVLVFSDYEHGVMTPAVVRPLLEMAVRKGKPVVVDSKSLDLDKYKGASIALPNSVEAKDMTSLHEFDDEHVAKYLLKRMGVGVLGLTMGADGIMLVKSGEPHRIFPALGPKEVVDVTGAGDTVTAAVAAGMSLGLRIEDVITFANLAAGVVVGKHGVATATLEEIKANAALHDLHWVDFFWKEQQ